MSSQAPGQDQPKKDQEVTVSGSPGSWTADPDPAEMLYGAQDSITWKLQAEGYKFHGAQDSITWKLQAEGYKFHATKGIQFTTAGWTGSIPSPVADSKGKQYSCTDDNDVTEATTFKYKIKIVGNDGKEYDFDPSIEDEPEK